MSFTFELKIDELTPALVDMIHLLDNPRDLMSEIAENMVESTKQRFKRGESPEGVTWAPKSPTTLKEQEGKDTRPLFGSSGVLSSNIFADYGDNWFQIGSDQDQAMAMQFGMVKGYAGTMKNGSPIPWGDIPARPYLGFSDEDQSNILATIAETLSRSFKGR